MYQRVLRLGAIAITSAMVLVACSTSSEPTPGSSSASSATASVNPSEAPEPTSVTVLLPFPPDFAYFQLYVAQDQGYFEDEGLDIEFEVVEGSGRVVQLVQGGEADYGFAGASVTIGAYANDPDLRAYGCHNVGQLFRVVTTSESGITSIADLAGGRLGVSDLAGGEVPIVEAMLKAVDLEPGSDVELVPVGDASAALVDALQQGTIDAYSSGYNVIAAVRAAGVELTDITPADFGAIPGTCMMATADALSTQAGQQIAIGIGRAWAKGTAFAAANEEAAYAIVCGAIPESCENEVLAKEILRAAIALCTTDDPDFPHVKLIPEAWQLAAQVLFDSGKTDHLVDVGGLMDTPEVRAIQTAINEWSRDAVAEDAGGAGQ